MTKRTLEGKNAQELVAAHVAPIPFSAIHLLESDPQESFTSTHEDLPHLPKDLPG